MLLDPGKITVLTNGINWPYMGMHGGYPGTNGVNELSGGSPLYQRKAIVWAAVTGLVRTCALVDTTGFDVYDSATEVDWLSFWLTQTGGSCQMIQPLGGFARKFFVDPSTGAFVVSAHNYSANVTKVVWAGGSPPTGITIGQKYIVETTPTSDTFTVKTLAGSSVTVSGQGGDGCYVSIIKPQTFSTQSKLTVPSVSINANQ